MFTVGLDISALDPAFKEHAQRGIGRYVGELKRYFDSFHHDVVSVEYFSHHDLFDSVGVQRVLRNLPAGVTTIRQQVVFPIRLAKARQWQAVHFPAHMDGPAWGSKRRIVTVLDLIPFILADMYRPDKGSFRYHFARFLENQAIRSASLVLAISETTKRDVMRLLGVPEERIIVTPLGVDEKFSAAALHEDEKVLRARYHIPVDRPIVLYVGGIDQRKNLAWSFEAFADVLTAQRQAGRPAPVYILAGRVESDRQFPRLLATIERLNLRGDVIPIGFVPDEDLLQLYKLSSAFFFSSLYEGFGLPPLEALAAGVPVVSSNASSMPEVLGDAALFFSPGDKAGAVKGLLELLNVPDVGRALVERGKIRATQFRWNKTGELTFRAYERMALGGSHQ